MIHFITSLIACEIISPVRGSADLGPTFRCHGWRGKGYRDMEYEATPIYVDMQYYIDEHVACWRWRSCFRCLKDDALLGGSSQYFADEGIVFATFSVLDA